MQTGAAGDHLAFMVCSCWLWDVAHKFSSVESSTWYVKPHFGDKTRPMSDEACIASRLAHVTRLPVENVRPTVKSWGPLQMDAGGQVALVKFFINDSTFG